MTIAEKIAALPKAVNTAAELTGKLSQGTAGPVSGEKSKVSADTTKASILSSLYASDYADYTRDDAVKKQWRKMNTVSLPDILDGKVDHGNRSLSRQDLEKRLQTGQISPEVNDIDLKMLEFELGGLKFESGPAYADASAEKVHKNIEYLASRYASMEARIKEIYAGPLQKQQLDRLDAIYQRSLERTSEEYAQVVGGILEKNGVPDEREKLSVSYQRSVEERVAEYREFLKENGDFTGLEDTEEAWLLKDDEYIAARLREQNIASQEAAPDDGLYTKRDLEVLGQYASEITVMEARSNTYDMNEERMGLELAILAMKTDTVKKEGGISGTFGKTLEKIKDGFVNHFMEQFEEKLADNRAQAMISQDNRGNAELDRESVWKVYDRTLNEYQQTGDLMKALVKGAEFAKDAYSRKIEEGSMLGVYRYMNGASYWNNFFKANNGSGYDRTGSTYSFHLKGFMDFKRRLENGEGMQMNLTGAANQHVMDNGGEMISQKA